MKVLASLRAGKWIEYKPRERVLADPRINERLQQIGAAAYATALSKGMSGDVSHMIAEAIMFKKIYKDLEYDVDLETLLKVAWE